METAPSTGGLPSRCWLVWGRNRARRASCATCRPAITIGIPVFVRYSPTLSKNTEVVSYILYRHVRPTTISDFDWLKQVNIFHNSPLFASKHVTGVCYCNVNLHGGRFLRGASLYRHRSRLFGRLWIRDSGYRCRAVFIEISFSAYNAVSATLNKKGCGFCRSAADS